MEEIVAKLQINQTTQNWMKLVKLEFLVILLAHIACCIFMRIGISEMNNSEKSWITKFQLENESIFEQYLLSFYYIIITMTTIGYGDITPASQYERMFIALVALIATNICAYSFSQINEIVKYEKAKNDNFNMMMQGVNADMHKLELDMSLQHRVRKFFEFQFKLDMEKSQGQEEMLNQLPSGLRNEVLFQTNNDAVQSIGLFASFSPDCQKEISLNIKQKYYKPDEIIFSENDINDKLYYIISGNVQTSLDINLRYEIANNQNGMLLSTLKKKDVFGYEGFILGQLNPYTAKSFKGAMLSYLEQDKLLTILAKFPLDRDMSRPKGNQPNSRILNQIEISHCIACGSSSHTLKRCHIVQLNLRYKKDKRTYNQEREEGFSRKLVSIYKSIKHNKEIQEQIVNFKMVQEQNSIMSDVYSVLFSEEDDNTTNKQSKKTNEEYDNEEFEENEYEVQKENMLEANNQGKRPTYKKETKKKTQANIKHAQELIDVYRRKSQREITNNALAQQIISTPKSQQMSLSNLHAIDEGEGESDRESQRTKRRRQLLEKEEQVRQMILNDVQNLKKESIYIANSNEKIESGLNVTPKINDKMMSIENNMDQYSKQSSKKLTFKSRTNTKNHSSHYSNRKLTGQSIVSIQNNQKTFTTIANEAVGQTKQNIPINVRSSSGHIEQFNLDDLPPIKKQTQIQLHKRSSRDSSSDENCNLKFEEDNQIPSIHNIENGKSLTLQQKIVKRRRMKQEKTYYEDEIRMRTIMQQSLLAPSEFNFFNFIQPSSQGRIDTEDGYDDPLPSPAQLNYRKYKQGNNQVMFDLHSSVNDSILSPSLTQQIIESKNRKSIKKGTQGSVYSHRHDINPEQRLSIVGLNKSNSVLYKQPSLANKLNQDLLKDAVSSPLSIGGGGGHRRLNQQTAVMIQSSPSINTNTTDFRIRNEYGIDNIDLLVIRKYMQMEQQKGTIRDYIFVQDNEIDIDRMRKFKVYFPKGNYNYIIKKIRQTYDKSVKSKHTVSGVQRNGARVSKLRPMPVGSSKLQNSRVLTGFGNSSTSRISMHNEKDKQ